MTTIFKPTYLYIKQHTVTGKLYFGKTTRDPEKYNGSGLHWKRHIRLHGELYVVTLWSSLFTDKNELTAFALELSEKMNIIASNQWANLKYENGLDGGSDPGKKWTDAAKQKIKGRTPWNKGKGAPKEHTVKIDKSIAYTGDGNPFFGKKHKEESKKYGKDNAATRAEVRAKMSGPRDGFLPHNHYTGWSDEVKAKISKSLTGRKASANTKEKLKESRKNLMWVHNGIAKPLQIKSHLFATFASNGYMRGRGPKQYW